MFLEKTWIPSTPRYGKIVGRIGLFVLVRQPVKEKNNFEFKPALLHLTNWPFIISCFWRRGWANAYFCNVDWDSFTYYRYTTGTWCCIATTIMISITTLDIQMQIHNTYSNTNAGKVGLKYTSDSVVQLRTHLLTSEFGSSTRGERQFLKVFRNHTMLTTLPKFGISRGSISISQLMVGLQLLNIMVWTQLQLSDSTSHHYGRTPTSTVCLNGRQPNCLATSSTVNSQLTLFQNLQILRTMASGHDVIHAPASFLIWGLLWLSWLSYPLRTSVKLYPLSVHLN